MSEEPRRKSFSFTEAEAEALVESSRGCEHDYGEAMKARAKLISWLLTNPRYVPPWGKEDA